ncbi:uncharacterized protein FIESC28_02666 [Fusarium coffeatum]|uniref:Uncharacterized protein n=1 Tax=Fusarium coffeatum TaxID=231269 RepID=A0A366S7D0_9HYPO|nr:uncharacterized protein FIESC28_02666 [Fusarium coffeatum]RBR24555.1 hypothetical protein FIESC28_02666 [Fusarium coffeatum]
MARFGAFSRRKSTATSEDFQHGPVTPPEGQSSFRVIERSDPSLGKSFDGGARMARASGSHIPKPSHLEQSDNDENMFADLKSGNRHSNASTAPSSTNLEAQEDFKHSQKKNQKQNLHDIAPRSTVKSSGSGFLNRAGRTFSFGVQKKHNASPPKIDNDIPPVPTIQQDAYGGRSRGLTESTTSTATPPKLEMENSGMDMGGDFGSMFSSFDKRASVATMRAGGSDAPRSLTSNRPIQPPPLSINKVSKVEQEHETWGRNEDDGLLGPQPGSPELDDVPPPVPRHQSSFKTSSRPSDIIEDEDAKLLQDSIAVGRLLSESSTSNAPSGRYRRNEDSFSSFERKPLNSSFNRGDDNLFEGTSAHNSRITNRLNTRNPSPQRNNKVMTPAQFEKYRKDKERHESSDAAQQSTTNDDDEDEINYDDDEDEIEKSKQQAKQRRKQEAHMAVYRQQMMKVTGEQPDMHPHDRPGMVSSMSAPQLHLMKTPSPGLPAGGSDEDDDEEVPLAILQAHGFPNKTRPPARLSTMGSNPNLRASTQLAPPRPGSAMGESNQNQRHSMLPAFARGLPQDPFVGASISKPAMRESLTFSGGLPASESQQSLPPGGLVGVIANEERSRAMRRGGPNANGQKFVPGMNAPQGPPFDNPQAMMNAMYNMPGMGMSQQQMPMAPPQLTVGDQAQLQMTQQMSQFMQMQMQFMQMMASNNQQQQPGMMPPMQPPYGGMSATQSMNDLSSRHSMMLEPTLEPPRRMDAGMRTMSMVQPSSGGSFLPPVGGYAGSIHGMPMGYTPSIAPSERSNIGLPGRYRPVSQMPAAAVPEPHRRTSTMSGALGNWNEPKTKSTINVVSTSGDGSDDDDEEGWEAMKAKRDKKRSMWKSKKGSGFGTMI